MANVLLRAASLTAKVVVYCVASEVVDKAIIKPIEKAIESKRGGAQK